MSKYRPEFGQHMTDKTYQNAIKLQNVLAKEPLSKTEREALSRTYKKLLQLNRMQAQESRGFQERTHQRGYGTQIEIERQRQKNKKDAEEALLKKMQARAYYQQQQQSKDHEKQEWQQTSDAIHSRAAANTYTAGPRPKTNTQEGVNPIPLIIIIIFILIYRLS